MQLTAAFVRRFCRMSVMRLSNPQRTHIQSCFEYDRTEVKIPSRLVNDDCTILFGDPPIAVHLNRCSQAISAGDCSRYSPKHPLAELRLCLGTQTHHSVERRFSVPGFHIGTARACRLTQGALKSTLPAQSVQKCHTENAAIRLHEPSSMTGMTSAISIGLTHLSESEFTAGSRHTRICRYETDQAYDRPETPQDSK